MREQKESHNASRRETRALRMAQELKRIFPGTTHTALSYRSPWELVVAVILSAQCTDKKVNEVTQKLFRKYRSLKDYVRAGQRAFEQDIRSTGFYRNKAKNILAAARLLQEEFRGKIPRTMHELMQLPGIARKTANVVLGNLYGIVKGIAVDTHVRRFVLKFDLSDSHDPNKIEQDLMKLLPEKEWFNFSNHLIEYGRQICPARKHDCTHHPLTALWLPAARRWPSAK